MIEASSGKLALDPSERAAHVDLLLTDVVMLGMTGPQLVEALRQRGKAGTVLSMSGYAQELIGKNASSIEFLPKPFTPSDLIAKVEQILGAGRFSTRRVPSAKADGH